MNPKGPLKRRDYSNKPIDRRAPSNSIPAEVFPNTLLRDFPCRMVTILRHTIKWKGRKADVSTTTHTWPLIPNGRQQAQAKTPVHKYWKRPKRSPILTISVYLPEILSVSRSR